MAEGLLLTLTLAALWGCALALEGRTPAATALVGGSLAALFAVKHAQALFLGLCLAGACAVLGVRRGGLRQPLRRLARPLREVGVVAACGVAVTLLAAKVLGYPSESESLQDLLTAHFSRPTAAVRGRISSTWRSTSGWSGCVASSWSRSSRRPCWPGLGRAATASGLRGVPGCGALTGVLNQAGHPDINIYGDRLIVLAWVLPVVGLPLLLEQVVRPRVRARHGAGPAEDGRGAEDRDVDAGRAPDWTPESLDEVKFGKAVGFGGHIRQITRTAQTEVGLPVRRTARGATALRGGAPWRPTPYQVFGGLFWLLLCLASWRVPMCCDFGQHAAVVERLKANLLHPAHPTADLPGEGSPFYSPYTVAQGAFARLMGLAGWEVVRLSAPLNLLVLLTGIGRFVRVLAPRRPWTPVCALLAMVLLWGTERAWSSGYLGRCR